MTKIFAKTRWNDTKIDLIKDCKYEYKATGKWIDWFIVCDANGFPPFLNSLMDCFVNIFGRNRVQKRTPSAKWFQLVGAVNQYESHTVELGTEGTFIAPENGRLWVYANDDLAFYGNNCGCIELTVEEKTKQ